YGTERFVLISTDKAVNPTSVMGTTKCLAERFVNTFSQKSKTKFIVTRFGNVLGSAGSVVPVFRQQIQQGGPITITDRRMTRFFMTIPEAAQLVLEASAFGKGGEIFVLDMGEPVKIIDLAHDMVRLAGLPEDSIEIVEIGMRPGEKLYEELYSDSEKRLPTKFPKLFAAEARSFDVEEVQSQIADLVDLSRIGDEKRLRAQLAKLVPEYGAHLDQ
ncbi:MAG: polysaccharide biosynthesis protein, partial [Thermoguttaceae bacterium]|nr:polysaccharide biosynthesis protein [Thermoguttaceae bacterium]